MSNGKPHSQQFELDFEAGLVDQFARFEDCVAASIYGARCGLNGVAAALDRSPSLLSRQLNRNPDDQRHLPLKDLPAILEATGDHRPIFWLVEKFIEDRDSKRERAMDHMANLLPQIEQLLRQARS